MLATALARHLETLGLVDFDETGVAGNAFLVTMPSSPDEAVAITPYGGREQPTRAPTDIPNIQIRVRSTRFDPRPGYERARNIYAALACLDGVTLDEAGADEVFVIGVTPTQSDVFPIGRDENDRDEWVFNLSIRTHAPTAHRPAISA